MVRPDDFGFAHNDNRKEKGSVMQPKRVFAFLVFFLGVGLRQAQAAPMPQYTIGSTLSGSINFDVTSAVSNSGQVAFTANNFFVGSVEYASRATVLRNGQVTTIDDPTAISSSTTYISPDGSIIGGMERLPNMVPIAFVQQNGVVTDLPSPSNSFFPYPTGSGPGNVIVGNYDTGFDASTSIGCVWKNGVLVGNLGGSYTSSDATGITATGVIGGSVYNGSSWTAALWPSYQSTSYVDIGAGAGLQESGIDVVTPNIMLGDSNEGPFSYSQSAGFQLLGSPAGVDADNFYPNSINSEGWITGYTVLPSGYAE